MKKRIKLKCWHCGREYTLFKQLNAGEEPKLLVACPFCEREGVVDLAPYRSDVTDVYRTPRPEGSESQSAGQTLDLPDVLPTRERDA